MRLRLEGRLTAATLVLLLLAGRASVGEARRIQQVDSAERSLRRLQQEETHAEDSSSASQAQAQADVDLGQGIFELSGVELGDEFSPANLTSSEPQTQEEGSSDRFQEPDAAAASTDPVLESSRQAAQARDGTDPDSYAADANESLTLVGDEPATNWAAGANSSFHTEADEGQEGILTFPDSLSISQNETAAEVMADTNSNSGGIATEEGLTLDEAVASSMRNASSEAEDPLIQFPILESTSPVLESSNGTLRGIDQLSPGSINGSLQAAITEPETASNVTAGNNSTSSVGVIGLLDAAANATGLSNSSLRAGNLTGLLEEGAAVINSTLNSTESLPASAASTASQLLSNTSSNAATAANLTANSTQHTTAGGLESDLQLPGQLLDGSADNSPSGLAGSLQLPGQGLNTSAVNGSSAGQVVNSSAVNSSSVLQDGREQAASAAGNVVHDSKDAAAGLLSGVRSWFNQNSSDGANTTLLSGLSSGANGTANSTGTTGRESTFGQMILEEELGSDPALAALSGSSVHGSSGHYSHHNSSSSRAAATAANHDRAAGLELSGVSNPAHTAFLSSSADTGSSAGLNDSALGHGASAGHTGNDSTSAVVSAVLNDPRSSASSTGRASGVAANTSAVNTSALNSAVLNDPNSSASAAGRGSVLASNTSSANTTSGLGLRSRAVPGSGTRDQSTGFTDFTSSSADAAAKQGLISTRAAEREDDFEASRASAGASQGGTGLSHAGTAGHSTSFNRDTTLDSANQHNQLDGSSGSNARSGAANQYAGLEREYEDSVLLQEGSRSSGAAATGARYSGTGSGGATGGGSRSGTGGSSASGLGATAAEQREQDRDTAFRASTGGMAVAEQASGGSTGSRYSGLPGAASQSWGQLASQSHTASTDPLHSNHALGSSSGSRQQPVTGRASELAYDDEDSSIGIGASSGQGHVTDSGGGNTGSGHSSGAGHRDPTNPNSVVEAHSAWMAQPHSALPRDGLAGSGGSLTAGNSQVSLASGVGAHSGAGHTNHLQADSDSTDGPLLVGGREEDELLPPGTGSSRQSYSSIPQQRSLLDIIVDNWVVLSAFVALVGTGTVLSFVFIRGMMPNPLDAISFSNVGTSGYVGNSKYISLGQEEEGSGWENGWGMDDAPRSSSASHTTSSSGSPPRATGMGKLKKGTFAKKKPDKKPSSWSNDF